MKETTKKKYYRLVDMRWEPYYSGYNETNLKELAYSMYSLWSSDWTRDDEEFYWTTEETAVEKIYSLLLKWERELAYFVEESDTPFDPLPDYF